MAQTKTEMQTLVKERDSLQQQLSKAQFEAADLRTQMHRLQAAVSVSHHDHQFQIVNRTGSIVDFYKPCSWKMLVLSCKV